MYFAEDEKQEEIHYLIDRKNDYYYVPGLHFPVPNDETFQNFHIQTIIDGELVNDRMPNGELQLKYLVFDCLMLDGNGLMHRTLDKRLAYFREKIYNPYKALYNKFPEELQYLPFLVEFKNMEFSYGIEMMFRDILPKLPHGNDGLIFTARNRPYLFGTDVHMLKWKPVAENSVDFRLGLDFPWLDPDSEDEAEGETEPRPDWDAMPTFNLLVNYGDRDYRVYATMYMTEDEWEDMKAMEKPLQDTIVECVQDEQRRWRFARFRDDKNDANHIRTVESVIESIQDRIGLNDLMAAAKRIRDEWKRRQREDAEPRQQQQKQGPRSVGQQQPRQQRQLGQRPPQRPPQPSPQPQQPPPRQDSDDDMARQREAEDREQRRHEAEEWQRRRREQDRSRREVQEARDSFGTASLSGADDIATNGTSSPARDTESPRSIRNGNAGPSPITTASAATAEQSSRTDIPALVSPYSTTGGQTDDMAVPLLPSPSLKRKERERTSISSLLSPTLQTFPQQGPDIPVSTSPSVGRDGHGSPFVDDDYEDHADGDNDNENYDDDHSDRKNKDGADLAEFVQPHYASSTPSHHSFSHHPSSAAGAETTGAAAGSHRQSSDPVETGGEDDEDDDDNNNNDDDIDNHEQEEGEEDDGEEEEVESRHEPDPDIPSPGHDESRASLPLSSPSSPSSSSPRKRKADDLDEDERAGL